MKKPIAIQIIAINQLSGCENRRYIEQVIQPSYGISSSWKNQYHDEWVLKGGWKD